MTHKFRALAVTGMLVGACILARAAPAHAGLGRAYSSLEADRQALGATLSVAGAGAYTVNTLALANGGVVKEFTRPDGVVFAVVWRAPGRPDLHQLLGDNFDTMQADNAARVGRRVRRPITVKRSDLLIQSGGHPGAFWGVALTPQLQPAGFSASDLK